MSVSPLENLRTRETQLESCYLRSWGRNIFLIGVSSSAQFCIWKYNCQKSSLIFFFFSFLRSSRRIIINKLFSVFKNFKENLNNLPINWGQARYMHEFSMHEKMNWISSWIFFETAVWHIHCNKTKQTPLYSATCQGRQASLSFFVARRQRPGKPTRLVRGLYLQPLKFALYYKNGS